MHFGVIAARRAAAAARASPRDGHARLASRRPCDTSEQCGDTCYVKNNKSQGSATGSASGGPEAPNVRPRAGRSVFNTPTGFTHFRPIFGLLFENVVGMLTGHSFLAPPFFVAEQAAMLAARVFFGNRARVVGLARSPTMRTPSPTTKLLAGMLASEAGGSFIRSIR